MTPPTLPALPAPPLPKPTKRRGHRLVPALVVALALLIPVACSSNSSSPPARAQGSTTTTSTKNTTAPSTASTLAARPFAVHVPPGYQSAKAAPLLVLLHGYGVTGAIQSAYLGLTPTVDAHGLLYVYLDGTPNQAGKQFWNATDACCAPPGSQVDDSAYITAVINDVKAHYNVDPKRVFVVGHSNGGFMAYRMACDHAGVVAAIVSIEGATYADRSKCRPSQAVSVLEVHGLADQTIKYAGGANPGAKAPYPGAVDSVEAWAAYDGCSTKPDANPPAAQPLEVGLHVGTVRSYSDGCRPGGHAELWTQPGGEHIPKWAPTFGASIVGFLLAHPKP